LNTFEYNRAVNDFADSLYRYAFSFCRNKENAEDVVQTTFAKVWEKHKNVDYLKVKSYLFTTAHNLLVNQAKHDKRYQNDFLDVHVKATYQKNHDIQEVLHLALDSLNEVQKSVVLLKDYEGYSYKEIGDILKLTESQVKVYIFRARKSLQAFIVNIEKVI
jgi:RNA polymerase sigma factor (sigma-70 family)